MYSMKSIENQKSKYIKISKDLRFKNLVDYIQSKVNPKYVKKGAIYDFPDCIDIKLSHFYC